MSYKHLSNIFPVRISMNREYVFFIPIRNQLCFSPSLNRNLACKKSMFNLDVPRRIATTPVTKL